MATNPFAQFVEPASNPFAQFVEPKQPATPPGQIPGPGLSQPGPPVVPMRQPLAQRAINLVRPTVEALGAAGGAVIGGGGGTLLAPGPGTALGGVAGAGLGYGLAKGGLDVLEQLAGTREPPRTAGEALVGGAKDVLTGATFEAGGRAAVQTLGSAIGKAIDLTRIPEVRAGNIAREALGKDIKNVLPILKGASPTANVAEITASVQNPTWQALIERATARDPQYLLKLRNASESQARAMLAKLAGGTTETDVIAGLQKAKETLNALTGPQREAALNRANLGRSVAEYEAQAGKLSREAAAQVQEVRDLISAGQAAEAWARLDLIKRGLPVGATKYTFFGEMADKAFNAWSNKAAQGSLDLGQGARFAKGAAESLRAAGIQPLESAPLINALSGVSRNPSFAGNDLIEGSLKAVADDIAKWTNSGGIIDARALDAIRKNSVNATIEKLRPGLDATAQRKLASGVLSEIRPAIVDAIETAGGTGYRDYLAAYTKGMQRLAERELVGEAARLWKTDKDAFVRLVMNESPEAVEKILGAGKYNIARELSENTMTSLRELAQSRIAQVAASDQATMGQKALAELLKQNMKLFRLPNRLQSWIANTNTALGMLEIQVGDKTMKALTEALKTPQGAANLLESLPAAERNRVAILLSNPMGIGQPQARAAATAAFAPEEETTP